MSGEQSGCEDGRKWHGIFSGHNQHVFPHKVSKINLAACWAPMTAKLQEPTMLQPWAQSSAIGDTACHPHHFPGEGLQFTKCKWFAQDVRAQMQPAES